MKVILIKDKSNLGEAGDVVKVAAGYARNYLFPREIVIPATKIIFCGLAESSKKLWKKKLFSKMKIKFLPKNPKHSIGFPKKSG